MILKLTWEEFCAAAIENITDRSSYTSLSLDHECGFKNGDGTKCYFDRPQFVEIEVLDDEP